MGGRLSRPTDVSSISRTVELTNGNLVGFDEHVRLVLWRQAVGSTKLLQFWAVSWETRTRLTMANLAAEFGESLRDRALGLLAWRACDQSEMVEAEVQQVKRSDAGREGLVVASVVRVEGREDAVCQK
jgi:hypothetical protein